jgi:hypothetical protein
VVESTGVESALVGLQRREQQVHWGSLRALLGDIGVFIDLSQMALGKKAVVLETETWMPGCRDRDAPVLQATRFP